MTTKTMTDAVRLKDCNDLELLRDTVQFLYDLLDDVDTADDQAGGDDRAFRKLARHAQQRKARAGISCPDGYELWISAQDQDPSTESMQQAARAWCADSTKNTVMDPVLATEFARILDDLKRGRIQ